MCLKWHTHTHKQTKIGMNAELRLIIFNDCCTGGPKGHSKLTLFEVLNELCVLKPCLITLQHYLNIIVFLWWSRNVFSAQFYCLMFCQTQNNATNHNNSIYNATQNTTLHTVWGVPPWGPYYLLCVIKLLQCSVTHSQSVSSHESSCTGSFNHNHAVQWQKRIKKAHTLSHTVVWASSISSPLWLGALYSAGEHIGLTRDTAG